MRQRCILNCLSLGCRIHTHFSTHAVISRGNLDIPNLLICACPEPHSTGSPSDNVKVSKTAMKAKCNEIWPSSLTPRDRGAQGAKSEIPFGKSLVSDCSLNWKDYVWVLTKAALILKEGRFPFWMTHDFQVSPITDIRSNQGPLKFTPPHVFLRELLCCEQLTAFKAANNPNYVFICTGWFLTRIREVITERFHGL